MTDNADTVTSDVGETRQVAKIKNKDLSTRMYQLKQEAMLALSNNDPDAYHDVEKRALALQAAAPGVFEVVDQAYASDDADLQSQAKPYTWASTYHQATEMGLAGRIDELKNPNSSTYLRTVEGNGKPAAEAISRYFVEGSADASSLQKLASDGNAHVKAAAELVGSTLDLSTGETTDSLKHRYAERFGQIVTLSKQLEKAGQALGSDLPTLAATLNPSKAFTTSQKVDLLNIIASVGPEVDRNEIVDSIKDLDYSTAVSVINATRPEPDGTFAPQVVRSPSGQALITTPGASAQSFGLGDSSAVRIAAKRYDATGKPEDFDRLGAAQAKDGYTKLSLEFSKSANDMLPTELTSNSFNLAIAKVMGDPKNAKLTDAQVAEIAAPHALSLIQRSNPELAIKLQDLMYDNGSPIATRITPILNATEDALRQGVTDIGALSVRTQADANRDSLDAAEQRLSEQILRLKGKQDSESLKKLETLSDQRLGVQERKKLDTIAGLSKLSQTAFDTVVAEGVLDGKKPSYADFKKAKQYADNLMRDDTLLTAENVSNVAIVGIDSWEGVASTLRGETTSELAKSLSSGEYAPSRTTAIDKKLSSSPYTPSRTTESESQAVQKSGAQQRQIEKLAGEIGEAAAGNVSILANRGAPVSEIKEFVKSAILYKKLTGTELQAGYKSGILQKDVGDATAAQLLERKYGAKTKDVSDGLNPRYDATTLDSLGTVFQNLRTPSEAASTVSEQRTVIQALTKAMLEQGDQLKRMSASRRPLAPSTPTVAANPVLPPAPK